MPRRPEAVESWSAAPPGVWDMECPRGDYGGPLLYMPMMPFPGLGQDPRRALRTHPVGLAWHPPIRKGIWKPPTMVLEGLAKPLP